MPSGTAHGLCASEVIVFNMRLLPFIAALGFLFPAHGSATPDPLGTETNRQGWFWYVDPPIETEELPEQRLPPDSVSEKPNESGNTPGYSTRWIRENLPKLRDAAIDDPSPTNVRAYLYVQRLAMDRASQFQSEVAFVTSADPYLDEVARFPTSSSGAAIGGQQAANAQEASLFGLSRTTGIWFFYRSDCPYCHAMVPVLLNLKRLYGFNIMPIALDGLPLDPRLPNFVTDHGQAVALGVEVTPSLFLVKPPNLDDVVPIAQGYVALSDTQERIVRMAYFHGWISQEEYERTRIANPLLLRAAGQDEQTMDPEEIVRQLRPGNDGKGVPNVLQPRPR